MPNRYDDKYAANGETENSAGFSRGLLHRSNRAGGRRDSSVPAGQRPPQRPRNSNQSNAPDNDNGNSYVLDNRYANGRRGNGNPGSSGANNESPGRSGRSGNLEQNQRGNRASRAFENTLGRIGRASSSPQSEQPDRRDRSERQPDPRSASSPRQRQQAQQQANNQYTGSIGASGSLRRGNQPGNSGKLRSNNARNDQDDINAGNYGNSGGYDNYDNYDNYDDDRWANSNAGAVSPTRSSRTGRNSRPPATSGMSGMSGTSGAPKTLGQYAQRGNTGQTGQYSKQYGQRTPASQSSHPSRPSQYSQYSESEEYEAYNSYNSHGSYGSPVQNADSSGYGYQQNPQGQQSQNSLAASLIHYEQPAPPSPYMLGASMPYSAVARFKPKHPIRIAISVAVAVVLVAACGVGGLLFQQAAPASAANSFCSDLQADDLPSAYALLSTNLQQQLTADQFSEAAQTLNTVDGVVQSCSFSNTPNNYTYHLGSSSATAAMAITRVNVGPTVHLQGMFHLKNEGGWKIDAFDISFFGVNLVALQVVNAYCAALRTQNYQAAYATLGNALTTTSASDFAQTAQLQDQVYGKVNICQVLGIGSSNSDTSSNLTLTIKRDTLGQRQDTVSLDVESNVWKISAIGPQLQGSDLGAYQVAVRFCSDLSKANYQDIYSLISSHFLGGTSEAYLAEIFSGQVILPPLTFYVRWAGCDLQPSTYKVSGSTASMGVSLHLTRLDTGQSATGPMTLALVKNGNTWQIGNFIFPKS